MKRIRSDEDQTVHLTKELGPVLWGAMLIWVRTDYYLSPGLAPLEEFLLLQGQFCHPRGDCSSLRELV